MNPGVRQLTSRDNPLLQRVRKLLQDPVAYRKLGQCWVEGEHLGLSLQAHGRRADQAICCESAWGSPLAQLARSAADGVAVVPDAIFKGLSSLPSPAGIGWLVGVPVSAAVEPALPTVVLDRLQDAGNVGSILRSAAALGVRQVLAISGTAGLWSPKVLRAGMGAQWGLRLAEGLEPAVVDGLKVPLLATSSHATAGLIDAEWAQPCAWIFGHEGSGVSDELLARCACTLRIPQPGGEESLNVAAAAAICLYESMKRRRPG